MRLFLATLCVAWLISNTTPIWAGEPTLILSFGQHDRVFTAAELLARPDVADITVPNDAAYHKAMTYRAVRLLDLLGDAVNTAFDTLEARAKDGYVSQMPMDLVTRAGAGGSVAWIAIEDPSQPWSKLPKKAKSAGPFYLVWQNPKRSRVTPAQWPYALATLTGTASPAQRWPQMAVASSFPADAPERRGMHVYVKHCIACHRIKGGGEADIGPDLAHQMSPTVYMTPIGLRLLIRDPAAVRSWPDQAMSGFAKDVLPDSELDDLIAYLRHMAPSN